MLGGGGGAGKPAGSRFSLLLLEENEYWFDDSAAFRYLTPNAGKTTVSGDSNNLNSKNYQDLPGHVLFSQRETVKGRVHICSKNLYFDPEDKLLPVLRLPFKDVASIRMRKASVHEERDTDYFIVHTSKVVAITLNEPFVITNFEMSSPESEFSFSLPYADLYQFLVNVAKLHAIARMPNRDQRVSSLDSMIAQREANIKFDSSRFVDLREVCQLPGDEALLASMASTACLCLRIAVFLYISMAFTSEIF